MTTAIAVEEKIIEVVDEKVANGEMFTAWDITLEVRNRTTDNVRHNEAKEIVHEMFNNGKMSGYERVMANLQGINPQPYIYLPQGADDLQYPGNRVRTISANQNQPMPTIVIPDNNANTTDDSDDSIGIDSSAHSVDARGTLCVPAKLVRQLGAVFGDKLHVKADYVEDKLIVSSKEDFAGSDIATYTVDHSFNVRITQAALLQAGISGKRYFIEGDNESIFVKLAK